MEIDPYMIPFLILENFNFIWGYKTYEGFINKTKALTNDKP